MKKLEVILLAGGPRITPVEQATGWPLCAIPISSVDSLMQGWSTVLQSALCSAPGFTFSGASVVVSRLEDLEILQKISGKLRIELESRWHRGTAGVVRDMILTRESSESDLILVIEMSASPAVDLAGFLGHWSNQVASGPRCLLGQSELGRFCGLWLCDRSVLDLVATVGFVDFKEQLLPQLGESGGSIESVVISSRALRVRTRADWLAVTRAWAASPYGSGCHDHQSSVNGADVQGPAVLQAGSMVEGARIVSSVVMAGAVVETGAVVARSVIGPGTRVRSGARVVDAMKADPLLGREELLRMVSGAR